MNKYVAIVIAVVLCALGLIIAYTMSPGDAPGSPPAVGHAGNAH
jgi:hypothetical protein